MKNNTTRFIPFLLAVCLVGGIAIGTFYANHFSGNKDFAFISKKNHAAIPARNFLPETDGLTYAYLF